MNNDSDREINSQGQRRRQRWQFTFFGGVFEEKITSELLSRDLNDGVFPLSACEKSDRVVPNLCRDRVLIVQILCDLKTREYLATMGFILGAEISVINVASSGSVIVRVQTREIGLGADIAEEILVTFVDET